MDNTSTRAVDSPLHFSADTDPVVVYTPGESDCGDASKEWSCKSVDFDTSAFYYGSEVGPEDYAELDTSTTDHDVEVLPKNNGKRFRTAIIKVHVGQESEIFYAHSGVLSQSPVLASYTSSHMESLVSGGFVDLKSWDPKVFGRILDYLYSGNPPANVGNIHDSVPELCKVYSMSAALGLDKLQRSLLSQLERTLDLPATACIFFESALFVYHSGHCNNPFRDSFCSLATACLQNMPEGDKFKITRLARVGGIFAEDMTTALFHALKITTIPISNKEMESVNEMDELKAQLSDAVKEGKQLRLKNEQTEEELQMVQRDYANREADISHIEEALVAATIGHDIGEVGLVTTPKNKKKMDKPGTEVEEETIDSHLPYASRAAGRVSVSSSIRPTVQSGISQDRRITIRVISSELRQFMVDIANFSIVWTLKTEIQQQSGIPKSQQILAFKGTTLDDQYKSLRELGLQDGDTVALAQVTD